MAHSERVDSRGSSLDVTHSWSAMRIVVTRPLQVFGRHVIERLPTARPTVVPLVRKRSDRRRRRPCTVPDRLVTFGDAIDDLESSRVVTCFVALLSFVLVKSTSRGGPSRSGDEVPPIRSRQCSGYVEARASAGTELGGVPQGRGVELVWGASSTSRSRSRSWPCRRQVVAKARPARRAAGASNGGGMGTQVEISWVRAERSPGRSSTRQRA